MESLRTTVNRLKSARKSQDVLDTALAMAAGSGQRVLVSVADEGKGISYILNPDAPRSNSDPVMSHDVRVLKSHEKPQRPYLLAQLDEARSHRR